MSQKPRALPRHIAVIMDGNGRWAQARGKPHLDGHRAGAEALHRVVEAAHEMGVEYLTAYAFSTENWARPKAEITGLMLLLRRYLTRDIDQLVRDNVRLRVIGDRAGLDADIVRLIDKAERRTAENTGGTLVLALNYGGREELTRAARQLAQEAAVGQLDPQALSADHLAARLYTHDIPDPDLIIRTSGEQRLSNFLLWQAAYAELCFSPVMWPDFGAEELRLAVNDYMNRERRFGGRIMDSVEAREEKAI